jgi:hypothetical protein
VQNDSELVAAEPRHEVLVAKVPAHRRSDFDNEPVPHLVAERVVDVLEAVDVDDQERPSRATRGARAQVLSKVQLEPAPVGHSGQRVPSGQVTQRCFRTLVPRDVNHRRQHVLRAPVEISYEVRGELAPAQPPPGAHEPDLGPGWPPPRAPRVSRAGQDRAVIWVHESRKAPPNEHPLRLAQEGAQRRVDRFQPAVGADLRHGEWRDLKHGTPTTGRPSTGRN